MLLTYLDTHLLDETRLLAATGLDAAALHALQARRMVPQPSYRVRLAVQCESFFGPHAEEATPCYYAVGTPAWIDAVQALGGEDEAYALFARRYTARLRALDPVAQADFAAEWRSFLDGTYGLCTKSGLPEEIAAKEWATAQVARLLAEEEPDRAALAGAVDLLDAASSPFAPHERARSSRHRLVDAVRARFRLQGHE
ncbi:DUF6058 family natural product biosynthesis protein [Massilia sp. METH4]|uniref:DUF6058 family natural product biosynthesis protein n=1 Tax=Massilia sp. METH4 TaxID=3123041 RepID=UPI0030D0FC60